MLKNLMVAAVAFSLASLILIISIFKVAEIKYVESKSPRPYFSPNPKQVNIDYELPSTGKIKGDSALWPVEALRDKVFLMMTTNSLKKADINLLLADKRLADSERLFKDNNPNEALSFLTKGEKYLETAGVEERKAKSEGMNTKDFLTRYALSALKHREVMENILSYAPEEVKPLVIKTEDYAKRVYNQARDCMMEASLVPPVNPFN